jgi:outer membrane protein TolC
VTDAVRLALAQNSDLRMAGEDIQSAKAALKQATGDYDSKISAGGGYQRTYLSGSTGEINQAQLAQTFQTVLATTLRKITSDPNSINNLDSVIAQSFNESQGSDTAIDNYNVDFSLDKKFRNGVSASVTYSPDLQDLNGKPTWPPFQHSITILLQIPITKYGTIANDAPELAAIKDYEGSLLKMAHAATKATSGTLDAYWKSVAAIEKFNISDRTYRVSDSLLSLSEQMVKGDAIAKTDLELAQARKAESGAKRNAALIEVFNTSKALASTLGLTGDQLRTLPYAYDRFPTVSRSQLSKINEQGLIDIALARRFDRKAALKAIEAKQLLAHKARIDLRPDLSFGVGGGGQLVDDNQLGIQGRTGYTLNPSFGGAITFSYAPANNSKEGALLDAQTNLNKSVIGLEDVSRDITLNIRTLIDTIRELAKQIGETNDAVDHYVRNLTDMRQKFRLGGSTLIDTITSESSLDTAAASLVDVKAQMAQTIGQLRYETATLLTQDTAMRAPSFPKPVEKVSISANTFLTLPDLSKEPGPAINDRNYEPNIKFISGHPPWHH